MALFSFGRTQSAVPKAGRGAAIAAATCVALWSYPASASPVGAENVVEAHIEAFDRHDIDAFMATYAPDAKIVSYAKGVLYSSLADIRRRYTEIMKTSPASRVVSRSVLDDKYVVDREITYRIGLPRFFDGIVIYTVVNGLIEREEFVGDGAPVALLPPSEKAVSR